MNFININKYSDKRVLGTLFVISLMFSLFIGIALTYNFDFTSNYNLLFQSDTGRVIGDITDFAFNHSRLTVHPLFVLITNSAYLVVKSVFINKMLSLVVLSSLVTSIAVVFMYKTLSLFSKNKTINAILSLCYLFSFSNYIFTAGIEVYNFAAMFLIILWYYVLSKEKNDKFSIASYTVLVALGIVSAGVTITNFIVFGIAIFTLWIFKKIKFKNAVIVVFFAAVSVLDLVFFQSLIWHNTPGLNYKNWIAEKEFIEYRLKKESVVNVLKGDYYHTIMGDDVYIKVNSKIGGHYMGRNYITEFNNPSIFNLVLVGGFYILLIILIIRNGKKHLFANIGLGLTLLFNTILHLLYGNDTAFLYSLHFLYLYYLLFGINLSTEKNPRINKIVMIYVVILLVCETSLNTFYFGKVINIVKSVLQCNYYIANFGVTVCFVLTVFLMFGLYKLIELIIKLIKKHKTIKEKDKKIRNILIIVGLCIFIHCVFIALDTSEANNKILFFRVDAHESKRKYIDADKYVVSKESTLDKKFKDEMASLENYEKEYNKLLSNYSNKKAKFLNGIDYYFFGFGNRKKYVYKDYMLMEVATGEVAYSLNGKNHLVIPNEYMVLVETWDGDYIKIYEDETGVHYNAKGKDTIIDGTNKKIDLYDFAGYTYQNTLKVLYGELLFNIKDGALYPNIFVYNKPWYRDAALGSMVLEKTGNISLISEWIKSIDTIYDEQNRGARERDNLGELLYLISTQNDINNELVSKIETEAERVAKENEGANGYYLIGLTDFAYRPLYQNLWYKLGLERLNKEFKYDISGLDDDYAKMCWWSDYKPEGKVKNTTSFDFPYLTIATYHTTKTGKLPLNSYIYPLSWERNASEADYSKMTILDQYFVDSKISPTHTWTASELMLLLMEEKG